MPDIILGGFTLVVVVLSLLSGAGSYLQGVREQRIKGGLLSFFAEVVLALVVGLIVASLCESEGVNKNLTHALVLIASNNGSDTIAILRELTNEAVNRILKRGQGK